MKKENEARSVARAISIARKIKNNKSVENKSIFLYINGIKHPLKITDKLLSWSNSFKKTPSDGKSINSLMHDFCESAELSKLSINTLKRTVNFLEEEVKETEIALMKKDYDKILDGFGDVAFVAINGIYKTFRLLGQRKNLAVVNTSKVLKRIAKANLNKIKDGVIKNEDGKIMKPKGWTAPNFEDLFDGENN